MFPFLIGLLTYDFHLNSCCEGGVPLVEATSATAGANLNLGYELFAIGALSPDFQWHLLWRLQVDFAVLGVDVRIFAPLGISVAQSTSLHD